MAANVIVRLPTSVSNGARARHRFDFSRCVFQAQCLHSPEMGFEYAVVLDT